MTQQILKNEQLLSDVRKTLDNVHRNIYLGATFSTFWRNEDGATIADNGLFGVVIQTNELQAQLNWNVAGGGSCEAVLIENPTLSVTGTPVPIYNLLRSSASGPTVRAWHSPTVTTGAYLSSYYLPGGWNNTTPGGMGRENTHWILNTGTFYVLAGINRAGSAQLGSVLLQWYEEELAL